MKKSTTFLIALNLFLSSCSLWTSFVNKNKEFHIATVQNNVCKSLSGKVVLYAIFVDSKFTGPWTEHDIFSTIDSINKAIDWVEAQANIQGAEVNIILDYYQSEKRIIPIEGKLARKTLAKTLLSTNGPRQVDKWADKIGRTALSLFGPDTSKVTLTKIKPSDRERLIARLRDQHKTDNVALLYFINNYFTDEISVTLHSGSDDKPEYAVVSFKEPGVIAHEFLHLFGALDLYITPYDNKKKTARKKAWAMKMFPNEIMAFPYRDIRSLEISPFTAYLIGWKKELDPEHQKLITGKRIKIAKY